MYSKRRKINSLKGNAAATHLSHALFSGPLYGKAKSPRTGDLIAVLVQQSLCKRSDEQAVKPCCAEVFPGTSECTGTFGFQAREGIVRELIERINDELVSCCKRRERLNAATPEMP